jgi:hypothetical protein
LPPPPPPEPTTYTHVTTFINGQNVTRGTTTLDKKTHQPTGTDVDKTKVENELPRPKVEKIEPKTDKAPVEARELSEEGKQ